MPEEVENELSIPFRRHLLVAVVKVIVIVVEVQRQALQD
jgi:hypothetical protein